ncbi:MAG: peptidase and in kexin sedolisin [Verrucomicrobia bacterium]|nr:peptidase and in kexin sedolisin [Verrucomicrobiota bacterium]
MDSPLSVPASLSPLPLKTILIRILGLFLTVGTVVIAAPGEAKFTEKEHAQGYLDTVVLAKPRLSLQATAEAAENAEGLKVRQKFDRIGQLRVIELAPGDNVPDAIARLKATGRYEYVEPDRIRYATVTPNDPAFTQQQWSLNNTGSNGPGGGVAGADIGAPAAWNTRTDSSVIVAVIDSGARLTHEDLAANLWSNLGGFHGISAVSGNGSQTDTNPNDTEVEHGSHVSGIIGAVGNNAKGIAGVAWNVKLMELRFLHGTGGGGSSSDCIACINYAINNGAKIINASFGSDGYSSSEYDAINAARSADIIFVAAAGNDARNVDIGSSYPAGYALDNVVTVAATTNADAIASYSDFGGGSVDLAAPGSSIYSCGIASDSAYVVYSGTSMAAPHVSGALALMRAKFPTDNYRQIINRLLRSVTKVPALAGLAQSGGRLNLANALSSTDSRPFNDDFSTRAILGSNANIHVRSSNVGANSSPETGEPTHSTVPGTNSLWWSWTAPTSTTVTFSTDGSSYNTKLAIYTGTALNALTPIASNDDDNVHSKVTSLITLNVTAGTTYQIAVDLKSGTPGLTLLGIGAIPANDDFANAQLLSGTSVHVAGSTLNSTSEINEPVPVTHAAKHTVWYRWVAPANGRYALYGYSAYADMLTAVYTGSAVGNLNMIVSNDDAAEYIETGTYEGAVNSNSLCGFNASAGATYYFQVDTTNVNPSGGDFVLTLTDAAWQFAAYGGIVSSPAVSSSGAIYFGAGTTITDRTLGSKFPENNVYAFNPNGTKKWAYTTGAPVDLASPAIGNDGNVYVASGDKKLYALDANNGALKWTYTTTNAIDSSPAIAADGTIYVRDDGFLYALTNSGSSATVKWQFTLSGATYGSPGIAADGTIYVGATGGSFYAINPDGTQKWKFTANGDVFTSPAIATDGTVYLGTLNGYFYALNPSGTQKWVWSIAGMSITSSPVLAPDGTIYFGAYDHKLHALTKDGVEKWSYTMSDEVRAATPAVGGDGTIYMPNYDGLVYAISPLGSLVRTYATAALVRSSPAIANGQLLFSSSDGLFYAFNLDPVLNQRPANSAWPVFQHNLLRDGRYSENFVTITTAPISQAVQVGSSVTLTVTATGPGTLTYQWIKDGADLPGVTGATYVLLNVQTANSGSYSVRVTSSTGVSATSVAAVLFVSTSAPPPGHLTNLSVRTGAGTGDNSLIVGFVVGGANTAGSTTLLIRGVGPTLADYGVGGALADPLLQVTQSVNGAALPIDTNDNWGGAGQVTSVGNAVGAFPFRDIATKDAALVEFMPSGIYSAKITGVNSTTGITLAEIYDASGVLYTINTPRLINVSARAQVGTGEGVLIAGFVVGGSTPRTVLIRGVGPTLSSYGVGGALADPLLELTQLINGVATNVATNDNWNGDVQISNAANTAGAFAFVGNSSKDAALYVTLQPGIYSAKVSGVSGTTGVALVEVYELP